MPFDVAHIEVHSMYKTADCKQEMLLTDKVGVAPLVSYFQHSVQTRQCSRGDRDTD